MLPAKANCPLDSLPVYQRKLQILSPAGELPRYSPEGGVAVYQPTPVSPTRVRPKIPTAEALIQNGQVVQTGALIEPISTDGLVVIAWGKAIDWFNRFIRPGATVELLAERNEIRVSFTPQVYLHTIDDALARAQQRPPVTPAAFNHYLGEAKKRREVIANGETDCLPEITRLAAEAEEFADLAYYRTFQSIPGEFRGVWLRPVLADADTIRHQLEVFHALGITHLFLETYYQGKTLYPSQVMADYGLPVQHVMFQKDPDLIHRWIRLAHEKNMTVHAWVQVFFAGNEHDSAETYGPLLQKYPQWRNIQRRHVQKTVPVPSDVEPGHYFLDPANPEVRAFLDKLILEIVQRHAFDGVNLDYIRYPASARPSASTYLLSNWGYTPIARQAFKAFVEQSQKQVQPNLKKPPPDPLTLTPTDPLWPLWVAWRKSQINTYVQSIAAQIRAIKPNLPVTAVVFPKHDPNFLIKLQDWPVWVQQDWVQALTPIGLEPPPDKLYTDAQQFRQLTQDKVPVYAGIFSVYSRQSPRLLVEQIEAVRRAGLGGVVLFDGARLGPEYQQALREGPFRPPEDSVPRLETSLPVDQEAPAL